LNERALSERRRRPPDTRSWLQRWAAKNCKCPALGCRFRAESWGSVARHLQGRARFEIAGGFHQDWLKGRGIGLVGLGRLSRTEEALRKRGGAAGKGG